MSISTENEVRYVEDDRQRVGIFVIKEFKKNFRAIRENIIHKETRYILFSRLQTENGLIYQCKNYSFKCIKKTGSIPDFFFIGYNRIAEVSFIDIDNGKILLDTWEFKPMWTYQSNHRQRERVQQLLKVNVGSYWYTLALITELTLGFLKGCTKLSLIDSNSNEIISQYEATSYFTVHQLVPDCDILAALFYRIFSPDLFQW
jgi:hypothetical protein